MECVFLRQHPDFCVGHQLERRGARARGIALSNAKDREVWTKEKEKGSRNLWMRCLLTFTGTVWEWEVGGAIVQLLKLGGADIQETDTSSLTLIPPAQEQWW